MLEALYARPPSIVDTSSSPHYSSRLRKITSDVSSYAETRQLSTLVEKEFSVLTTQDRFDVAKYVQIFGQVPRDETFHKENVAILRAIRFFVFKTGNCSARASYAAFELSKLLVGSVTIGIQSHPARDQYILMLQSKEKGSPWYVYDAITNPELLFNLREYQDDILPLFPRVERPALKYTLTIKPALLERCQSVSSDIKRFIHSCSQELSDDALMSDFDFLVSSGLVSADQNSATLFRMGLFNKSSIPNGKITILRAAIDSFKRCADAACHISAPDFS